MYIVGEKAIIVAVVGEPSQSTEFYRNLQNFTEYNESYRI